MSLSDGTRLGRYVVTGRLGAGAMGEVYRARDERIGREVAIKVLPASLTSDPDRVRRFEQEARAVGSLNHPNVLAIYDVGVHDGSPFIVSELLLGQTLRASLAGGALPTERTLDYAAQIVHGLTAAHGQGIVHRDLKPDNLFVTEDGRVKILDFGLAKLADKTGNVVQSDADVATMAALTTAGTVLGTAAYMAPEQVRGEPADARSDLFAFGAILFEMIAGRRAFDGQSTADTMTAVLRDDPPAVTPGAGVAAALERIARRCLRKRPQERFQSASDVGFALTEATASSAMTASAAVTPPPVGRGVPSGMVAMAGVLVLALAIAGGAVWWWRGGPASARPAITSLAVLPLKNLSGDPEQEYFSDGVTSALIAGLGRVGELRVISQTSSMTYKAAGKPLPQIASELNVEAIVEGSVQRSGGRVHITARLVDGRTERQLWSKDYERDIRDVLSLQNEVARAITDEIAITLTPQESSRLAATRQLDAEAHEAYLRGRHLIDQGTEAAIQKALGYFAQATTREPTYAAPYAGMADAYTALRTVHRRPHDVMPLAKAAAAAALRHDPLLAEAHVSMAGVLMYYEFDWAGAERELRRAIELAPNLAVAHDYLALYLAARGRHEEAWVEAQRARALDPVSLTILNDTGWVAYLAKAYSRTIEANTKAIELSPTFWPAHRDLGLGYEKMGRFPEAIASLERVRQHDGSPTVLEMLAGTYVAAGRHGEARQVLAELEAAARQRYVCPYEVATVHACLGDTAQALDWLDKGIAEKADCMPWVGSDSKLDALRREPRFQELMRRMGLDRP